MKRAALLLTLAVLLNAAALQPAAAYLGDIVFTRKSSGGDDYPPATFPHFVHRMQFKCYVCHDDIFKMKAGSANITMDAIEEGKYCGTCHNGKTAFQSTFETCPRCHRP